MILERVFPQGMELVTLLGAIGILAGSVLLGWLVRHALMKLHEKAQSSTTTVLDEYLLSALANPILVAVMLLGIYFGLAYLPLAPSVDQETPRWLWVALVATGVIATLSIINALFKWYACEIAGQTKTTLDDKLIPVVRSGVTIIGSLLGVLLILRMLGIQHQGINSWLAEHGSRILIMVALTLAAFFGLSRALPVAVKKTVERGLVGQPPDEISKRSDTLVTVLVTTGQVLILGAGGMMLMNELLPSGIGPLLAGVGVAGIAIGFGAQSLVKDVVNGLFIIMEGQYCVGDIAKIADITGKVVDINLRRTVLRDGDGTVHFVPNGEIKVASNFTKGFSGVNMNVSVSYETDLDRAMASITAVGAAMAQDPLWRDDIIKPPKAVWVEKLGDSGIDIKVTGETKAMRQWEVSGELRKRLKEVFDKEGIEMPYPHTKVYFGDPPLNLHLQEKRNSKEDMGDSKKLAGPGDRFLKEDQAK